MEMRRIFITALFLLMAGQAWGTNYYIRQADSCGNANCTQIDPCCLSTATAAAGNGDTIYFYADDTWTGTPPLLTTTAGVTYDGSTYGSGTRATLQATSNGSGYCVAIMESSQGSPVLFQGFKVDGNGHSVGGIYIGYPSAYDISYVTVNNCEVTNGITSDPVPSWYYGIIVGQRQSHTTSNITITNNELHHTGHEGITVYPSWMVYGNKVDGVIIRGNNIHHCGLAGGDSQHPLDVANDSDNVTIEFNYIHDNAYAAGFSMVQYADPLLGSPNGLIFRYNIVADNAYGGFVDLLNAPITGDAAIYGNLFINNGIYFAGDHANSSFKVYNNIVYGPTLDVSNHFMGCAGIYETSTNTSGIEFKNNIFYCDEGLCFYDYAGLLTSSQHSNNLYFKASAGNLAWINKVQLTSSNIKTWEPSAQNTNPTFTGGTLPTGFSGTYGVNMVPNTTYFAIASGNAIGNGATLGSPYNSAVNYAGVATPLTRPAGAYDIGAYQYTGVGAYPASSGGFFIGGIQIR